MSPARAVPFVVVNSPFTGKRRPQMARVCECGCGEGFSTTDPTKKYKNTAHKQRAYRARVTTRVET